MWCAVHARVTPAQHHSHRTGIAVSRNAGTHATKYSRFSSVPKPREPAGPPNHASAMVRIAHVETPAPYANTQSAAGGAGRSSSRSRLRATRRMYSGSSESSVASSARAPAYAFSSCSASAASSAPSVNGSARNRSRVSRSADSAVTRNRSRPDEGDSGMWLRARRGGVVGGDERGATAETLAGRSPPGGVRGRLCAPAFPSLSKRTDCTPAPSASRAALTGTAGMASSKPRSSTRSGRPSGLAPDASAAAHVFFRNFLTILRSPV